MMSDSGAVVLENCSSVLALTFGVIKPCSVKNPPLGKTEIDMHHSATIHYS